jgi:hypothetical protein
VFLFPSPRPSDFLPYSFWSSSDSLLISIKFGRPYFGDTFIGHLGVVPPTWVEWSTQSRTYRLRDLCLLIPPMVMQVEDPSCKSPITPYVIFGVLVLSIICRTPDLSSLVFEDSLWESPWVYRTLLDLRVYMLVFMFRDLHLFHYSPTFLHTSNILTHFSHVEQDN